MALTKEIREEIRRDRNYMRTQLSKNPTLYNTFRKKCIDMGLTYHKGIEMAIRMWLDKVTS